MGALSYPQNKKSGGRCLLAFVHGLNYVGMNFSVVFTVFYACHLVAAAVAAAVVFIQEQNKAVKANMFQSICSDISLAGTMSHGHL